MIPMPLPRRMAAIPLMALLVAACATPDPTTSPEPSRSRTLEPSLAPAPASPTATELPIASADPTQLPFVEEPPALGLEEVARVNQPVSITASADGRLYVNERQGRILAIEPTGGQTEVVLDITDRVGSEGSEQGLLGFALHPAFQGPNPRAFVHYTDRSGDTVLSEFSVTDSQRPARFEAGSERVLLRVDQPFSNHNGGQLTFGPDGYLWFGLGDGGSGGDPQGNGQNRSALLGKILRLDIDADPTGDREYAIPGTNPFADGADGAPEVYLYGLRNPWRFSFDRQTGLLWVADVGQNALEEVSRVDPATDAGANLGWNWMEASACYLAGCSSDGLLLPVAEYGRDQGCSVTGGYVYRGAAIERLAGWYLFSDYCSGLLFGVPFDQPIPGAGERAAAPRVLLQTGANVSTFGEDADGELYVADHATGAIYRIVAAP